MEGLVKKTTVAAVFCKVFSRRLGLQTDRQTDKLPNEMRRRDPLLPFLDCTSLNFFVLLRSELGVFRLGLC